jgi:dCTP deaminase
MSRSTPWRERLIIEPFFDDVNFSDSVSASVDFFLGNRFTMLQSRRAVLHNPLADDSRSDIGAKEVFVPMGEELSVQPGQVVLGTTLEWFRFPRDIMAYLIGRSIWGRRGFLPATATAVHPGSSGTITLELANLSSVAIVLKPGVSVGQLFFHLVEGDHSSVSRRSVFMGAIRPLPGIYKKSSVERLLLGLK